MGDGAGSAKLPGWRAFPSRGALARALAADIADALDRAIAERGAARLAVSGGSTPGLLFDALARTRLAWQKVVVTLVDERFVPPGSERSNERLVRSRLLVEEARLARFLPLWSDTPTVEAAADAAETGLALLGGQFDAVVLGMGADAHTASFFPDAAELGPLTDPDQRRRVMPVHAPSAGEPRLTLTLPQIAGARLLALHIEGAQKRAVLERSLGGHDPRPPVARVFDAARQLRIYWAP